MKLTNDHSLRLCFFRECALPVSVLVVSDEVEQDDQNEHECAHACAVFIQLVFHVDIISMLDAEEGKVADKHRRQNKHSQHLYSLDEGPADPELK